MKKLNIELKQNYKQFKAGSKYILEGDLIILSGINGSGKSQLIDILDRFQPTTQRISSNVELKKHMIDAVIDIDGDKLERTDIFKRTFKENTDIKNTILPIPKNSLWNREEAWKTLSDYNLWNNDASEYSKSKAMVMKILKSHDISPIWTMTSVVNHKLNISKEQFEEILPDDFIWEKDDLFSNRIENLFFEFAAKRHDEQARLGRKNGGFDNDKYIENAPWTILNNIFEVLKFNYRFKRDYEFETPNLKEIPMIYPVLNKGTIDEQSPRELSDLSDGEKSIISLAFALVNEEHRPIEKLLLLDEFDNTLNPSLVEALFKVLEEYFIKKGVMVIMTTHSPVTISLAPEYASFYELFKQDNASPKILQVQKEEYTELKIANKEFYDKIANQEKRIKELEKKNLELGKLKDSLKPLVVVEDYYTEIYKIAYLKLNNIEFNRSNVHEKFDANAKFEIYWQEGSGGVAGFINCANLGHIKKPIIGLFDYDREGVEKYKGCKNFKVLYEEDKNTGIYKKRKDYECYALLLPVPERLNSYVQKIHNENIANNYFEVEHYLPKEFIEKNRCFKKESVLGQDLYVCKKDMKKDLWKDLVILGKDSFQDFVILFDKINELLEL